MKALELAVIIPIWGVIIEGASTSAEDEVAAPNRAAEYIGRFEPTRIYSVCLKFPGTIADLMVEEGQHLAEGEAICVLEKSSFETATCAAELRLAALKAQMQKLMAGPTKQELSIVREAVEIRKAELEAAEIELARVEQRLTDKKAMAQAEVGLARIRRRIAQARLAQASEHHAIAISGPRPEEIRIKTTELQAAELEIRSAKKQLAECRIESPLAGIVLKVFANPGEHVTGATATAFRICDIADPMMFRIVVFVPQERLRDLDLGQSCEVQIPAIADSRMPARISRVLPTVEPKQAMVQLHVELTQPIRELAGPKLIGGLYARVWLPPP